MSDDLTYSHYCEIIWLNLDEIKYYINVSINENLTVRELRKKVKNKEYERLPDDTKNKIINNDKLEIKDLVPNPIVISNKSELEIINEKILHNLILENIENFMEQLGSGYSFIKSEYKIKIGSRYNYIDLLLFNYKFNCFIVIELKVSELKKEHIGQIKVYMNYIDSNVKEITHDKTIGIIICKKDNKFVMEYCSDNRIISREYKVI